LIDEFEIGQAIADREDVGDRSIRCPGSEPFGDTGTFDAKLRAGSRRERIELVAVAKGLAAGDADRTNAAR
jgi:hypothetical protein